MPTGTFQNLSAEKKERVLNAAVNEFGCRSLREANISNIVKEARIARGSIYQYFNSKAELYAYVFETLRARRAEYVRPAFLLYKKEPFLRSYEELYLRDSEYLLMNPSHIELGKKLYGGGDGVSLEIIRQIRTRYADWFLPAIEYDKERGVISPQTHSRTLCGLCVHFVTDEFIFRSVISQMTMADIRETFMHTMQIIQNGIRN